MSDPENKSPPPAPEQKEVQVGMPLHMASTTCGPFAVISAVAPGLVVTMTVNPAMWPPKTLQALLESIAPTIGANGAKEPQDTATATWANTPKASA